MFTLLIIKIVFEFVNIFWVVWKFTIMYRKIVEIFCLLTLFTGVSIDCHFLWQIYTFNDLLVIAYSVFDFSLISCKRTSTMNRSICNKKRLQFYFWMHEDRKMWLIKFLIITQFCCYVQNLILDWLQVCFTIVNWRTEAGVTQLYCLSNTAAVMHINNAVALISRINLDVSN